MPIAKPNKQNLSGLKILVTRPKHQAESFVSLLEDAGATVVKLPAIDILYTPLDKLQSRKAAELLNHDHWIFTSVNAVIGAHHCQLLPLTKNPSDNKLPKIAAIGQATKQCLIDHNVVVDLVPKHNTSSEQFIEQFSDSFNFGDKIVIFRGNNGRNFLKEKLEFGGATVEYCSVYNRQLPDTTAANVNKTLIAAMPCIISFTSDLGLINLLKMVPDKIHKELFNCQLVVNSQRCLELARKSGFHQKIVVADPPGNAGQINALAKLAKR